MQFGSENPQQSPEESDKELNAQGPSAPNLSHAAITRSRLDAAQPPIAQREDTVLEEHGEFRPVPYLWMRNHDDPRLRQYLDLENSYADKKLAPISALQADILKDFLSRIPAEVITTPVKDGGHLYYSRQTASQDYKVHCRRSAADSSGEEVILDENELAQSHTYFAVGEVSVSPDGRYAAYLADCTGDERYQLKIKDLQTGLNLADSLDDVGSVIWGKDASELFLTKLDELNRPYAVVRHQIGAQASEDQTVFSDPREDFHVEIDGAKDGSALIITSGSWESSEVHYLDLKKPNAKLQTLAAREPGVMNSGDICGGWVYLLSNKDAPNYRLLAGNLGDGPLELRELLPHSADEYLVEAQAFNDFVLMSARRDGKQTLFALDKNSGSRIELEIPFEAYALSVEGEENPDPNTRKIRLHLSSFVVPPTAYDFDLDSKALTELDRSFAGTEYTPENYKTERIFASSADGVQVPMTVFSRADRASSGPALLIGYGAYGDSYDPEFRNYYLSLIDRGVAVALANIRGGAEFGAAWFEEGRLDKKQNSFNDFIACAEKLCEAGITSKEQLAAYGRSAGGLLMGAMIIQRPDLFKAVLAQVPFVDVITTMADSSINLVEIEKSLWGDPANPEHYKFMRAYSPTDNVAQKDYPHIYFEAGWHDPAVPVSEPAVLTAALRAAKTDDNDLIMRTHFGAGHGGASGRVEKLNELAEAFAFILSKIS